MHFAILETDKILRKGYESNSSIISEDEEYIFLAKMEIEILEIHAIHTK